MSDDERAAYETMRGSDIDDAERDCRRRTLVKERQLGDVRCTGLHHQQPVACRFAPDSRGELF